MYQEDSVTVICAIYMTAAMMVLLQQVLFFFAFVFLAGIA